MKDILVLKKVLTVKEIEKIILVDYTKSDLASNNVNDLERIKPQMT